ncbi:hypothetical protein [Halomonas llamarensis]|uniref:DUF3077 domain-containing protein n=1 Tax=Halomonas llamarensis TaxID=2945104 RepID=A0ABT0SSZ2_9GAMM|nr:hypothetical protein [Halomonas llamarensis]MCL7930454.1 hypothetical protein [Halomonas llamarensis]
MTAPTTSQSENITLEPVYQAEASRVLAETVGHLATDPNVESVMLSTRAVEIAEALVAGMLVIQRAQASGSTQ